MSSIVVRNLTKSFRVAKRRPGMRGALASLFSREYRDVLGLDQVSFNISAGELVGYIGPNGAGKSTTVKILSGILVPDSGECTIDGRVPWKDRVAHVGRIGVVFGQRTQLWWDLPVIDSFELLRDIYRVAAFDYRRNLDELVGELGLGELLEVPVRQLSLGQRMRCDLAAALLHSPALLFLDEPTIGLDAVSKLAVRSFVRRINRERGTTVILTTHDMDDIEALCSRVMVIGRGRIVSDGTLEALRSSISRERWLTIDLLDDVVHPIEGAVLRKREGRRLVFSYDPERTPTADLIRRATEAHAVCDLFVENPPIEHIIARLYEGSL